MSIQSGDTITKDSVFEYQVTKGHDYSFRRNLTGKFLGTNNTDDS